MWDRVKIFIIHVFVHVFLYEVPRWLHILFVKAPVTAVEWVIGHQPFTYNWHDERQIRVITSQKDPVMAERLVKEFGINHDMMYHGPLYNGDVQTVLGNMGVGRRVTYERELLEGFDGNPICLDWLKVPKDAAAKGVVLVIPGIGNYSQTPYIQRLVRNSTQQGFHVCVLSPRGMGSAPLTTPRLTCITFTQDARTVLQQCFTHEQVAARFGTDLPVFLLGYSAGGSTLLKTVVEEFAEFRKEPARYPGGLPVKGVVCMNAPFNMFVHHEVIERAAPYYQKPMLHSMYKYAAKHADLMTKGLPGMPSFKDKEELMSRMRLMKTANDFNEHVVAPHFGYEEGAKGYYKDAAAFKWLEKTDVSIPIICVASKQDPITGISHTEAEWQQLIDDHPNVMFVETPVGGHLAYLPNPLDEFKERGSFLIDLPLHAFQHAAGKLNDPKSA